MESNMIHSTGKILFDMYRKGFTKEFDLGLNGQLVDYESLPPR